MGHSLLFAVGAMVIARWDHRRKASQSVSRRIAPIRACWRHATYLRQFADRTAPRGTWAATSTEPAAANQADYVSAQ